MDQQRMPFRFIAVPTFLCVFTFLMGLLVIDTNKVWGVGLMVAAAVLLPVQVVIRNILWKNGHLPMQR